MTFLRALIVRSCALLVLGLAVAAQDGSGSLRSLRFQVLTSYGEELKYDLVTLNIDHGGSVLSHCKNFRCTNLKFGTYSYKLVRPSTGDALDGTVLVSESDQVVTVDAGPGGGGASRDTEGFTIEGMIMTPHGAKPPDWVRLQSVYSSWSIIVAVEPTGRFALEYVPPGVSLLVLFRAGKVLQTELVSTDKARSKRVRLEVTLGHPPAVTSIQ
jgi:hypothetical protein